MTEHPIVAVIRDLDATWQARRFDELARFFDENVQLVVAGGAQRLEGREAMVASYREFMNRCEVTRFEATDFRVTQAGDAAVVEYGFDIDWTSGGKAFSEKGREVLVLARRAGAWRVFWRAPMPATPPPADAGRAK